MVAVDASVTAIITIVLAANVVQAARLLAAGARARNGLTVVIVAHGHTQFQRTSRQCVADLLGRNRISDGGQSWLTERGEAVGECLWDDERGINNARITPQYNVNASAPRMR
ncbi:hypothetical protein EVAR_4433_1 [Eumeta japonica]|uniref:Uncharacterized protein n=1 Tax=Eumeta variegata TaxID=151549 RepID=A0A4C1T167_EUMVA|nr:hypothetical protein EVAR_4433_1 [Eumeta japonica]